MSSNSLNKTPISRTPPNLSGQARVDLIKNDFDSLVWNKGYDVFVDKSLKCPCRVESNNQALSSCKNCGGSGYVFINRYQTKLVLQSMNLDTKYREWSEEKLGTVRITARTEDELTFMDRITLLNGLSTHIQTIHPIVIDNEVKARIDYPPLEIEEIFAFVDSDVVLRRLNFGSDVSTSGVDYSVNENILTFASEFLDWNNFTVTIRYKHYPRYYVIDLPREVIETDVLDSNTGRNKSDKLPVHAIGRRSHYVLDEQNFNNDFLLDNSYTVTCEAEANVIINANKLC